MELWKNPSQTHYFTHEIDFYKLKKHFLTVTDHTLSNPSNEELIAYGLDMQSLIRGDEATQLRREQGWDIRQEPDQTIYHRILQHSVQPVNELVFVYSDKDSDLNTANIRTRPSMMPPKTYESRLEEQIRTSIQKYATRGIVLRRVHSF